MDQVISDIDEMSINLNKNLEIVDICDHWCTVLGYLPEEIKHKNIGLFFSQANSLNQANLHSFLNCDREVEFLTKSGGSYHFIVRLTPLENSYKLSAKDITAIRKYQHWLGMLETHAQAGFWERRRDGQTFWSDQVYELFELPHHPIDQKFRVLINRCYRDGGHLVESTIARLFIEGGSYDLELEIITPNGKRKWMRTIGSAIEHNGQIVRVQGFIQDVTSYRENLRRLFESQETLQFALSANGMGAWKLNFKTGELLWDKNMAGVFGLQPEQVPRTLDDFYKNILHPDDLIRIKQELGAGLGKAGGILNTSFRIINNGQIRYIACRAGYSESMGDLYYIGTNWDITKEKETEETIRLQEAKIISSSRLSSLGEMAGGIAHEINNPLSVILARTGVLRKRVQKGDLTEDELTSGLQKVEETCSRIVTIINGLRTISRDGNKDPMEKLELQKCINETILLVSEKLRNNSVELKVNLPERPLFVKGRLVQLEQVLMNVLHNSYDAISDLSEKSIELTLMQINNKAELRVRDSGDGVPDGIIEKIFMPFFTTKEIGKGTGIGLSISKSIIEEHGGEFYFTRISQKDWYFSVVLPLLA